MGIKKNEKKRRRDQTQNELKKQQQKNTISQNDPNMSDDVQLKNIIRHVGVVLKDSHFLRDFTVDWEFIRGGL